MFEGLKNRLATFWANFRWDDYVKFLNGPIAAVSASIPIFGYLIIFNDYIWQASGFQELAGGADTTFFLKDGQRIRFIYFGLLLVGTANILFRLRKPYVLKYARTLPQFIEFGKSNLTVMDFTNINHDINDRGHATRYGKYYTDDWNAFLDDATWSGSGKAHKTTDRALLRKSREHVDFSKALARHEDLIRSMLVDHFTHHVSSRKIWLLGCIFFASLGYFLLFIPSFDIFLRVVQVTIGL